MALQGETAIEHRYCTHHVASTYKRGIDFVNIPTTLLSMVDASVGGKTGVDLGVLKNQIGLFANPQIVISESFVL